MGQVPKALDEPRAPDTMLFPIRLACALGALCAFLGACRSEPAPAPGPPPALAPGTEHTPEPEASEPPEDERAPLLTWGSPGALAGTSNDGTWRVQFRTLPEILPLNEEFELEAAVFDAEGRLARDVELGVDAAMPQHRHGLLRAPSVAALPDGRFAARGLVFHMPGAWELYFDVTREGVTERTQFAIELD